MSRGLGRMIPTYDLLIALQKKFADTIFWFVVGSDVASQIHSWENGETLIKDHRFIVFTRKGYQLD